jgi:hypothetical protein
MVSKDLKQGSHVLFESVFPEFPWRVYKSIGMISHESLVMI